MKLNEMSATELSQRLSRREVTALQVVDACLAEIQLRDRPIHAWAALDAEFARRQARELDAGAVRGPLHGLPIGVKDILDTADLPSEYGSPIYAGHRPAWDAACVACARTAGAVILGKTVTTEFATMHPAATVNPHDPRRTPGGSSSGSAAGVAAHMVPFAYGTQTVGSIIRPAAYCGVVGYKPSFGMLSRNGMKMACESLDTVGVIARTVEDAALLVAGSAMRSIDVPAVDKPRLGLCRTANWSHMTREGVQAFEAAVRRLAQAGAVVVEQDLPQDFAGLDAADLRILDYEIARSFAYESARHRDRISAVLLARIDSGAQMAQADNAKAVSYAAECRRNLAAHMQGLDAIVTPSATGEAPLGLDNTGNTAMNRLWTLLHGPCVTVPAGRAPTGMPLGLQVVGLPGADERTLGVARWAEALLKP
jgi:Asp-tRNA(Asn)/Glu-tRNA(Gln) amidotransferase A subunit family amidase